MLYKLYDLTNNLQYYYKFVVNNYNSIVSEYDKKMYVLIKKNNNNFNARYLFDNNAIVTYGQCNWDVLWKDKCDYIREYRANIKGKYALIDDSMDYYIGLAELAINLLPKNNSYMPKYVTHQSMLSDYFDPINITIDIKERDFAEYLKLIFLNYEYSNIDLYKLLYLGKDKFDYSIIISRVIFPNYYFDLVDSIVAGIKEQASLIEIINRNEEFMKYVNNIIKVVSSFTKIKKVF